MEINYIRIGEMRQYLVIFGLPILMNLYRRSSFAFSEISGQSGNEVISRLVHLICFSLLGYS
jgi:hypothetical protein